MTRRFLKPTFVSMLIAGSALACPPQDECCETTDVTGVWTTAAPDQALTWTFAEPSMWTTAPADAWGAPLVWYSPASFAQDANKQSVITAKEITIVLKDGEHTIEFTQSGDDKSARVDGKTVPSKRIVEKDKLIIIMDENGEPLCTLNRLGNGFTFHSGDATANRLINLQALSDIKLSTDRLFDANNNIYTFTTNIEAPKAMIGITMGEIEDVTAAQLGVKPDEVVLVTDVAPDLAAAKAGLRKYDVIVKVDGRKPANEEKIREIVRKREPGEKVGLTVLREAKPMEFEVELLEFKPGAWGNVEGQFLFGENTDRFINVSPRLQTDGRIELQLEPSVQGLMQRQELSPDALRKLQSRALELTEVYSQLPRHESLDQAHVLKLHELLDRELHNAKVDEKVILKVKEAVGKATKNLDFTANVIRNEAPLSVQIVPRSDGQQILVMPEVTEQYLRAMPQTRQLAEANLSGDRLQRLEERMARLEALLEKLVEMRESSGGR